MTTPAQAAFYETVWEVNDSHADLPPASYVFGPPDVELTATNGANSIRMEAVEAGWYAEFTAPVGSAIVEGRRYPFPTGTTTGAGVAVGQVGGNACVATGGFFQFYELQRDPDTQSITRVSVGFNARCADEEDHTMDGEIRINMTNAAAGRSILTGLLTFPASPQPFSDVALKGSLRDQYGPIGGAALVVTRREGAVTTTTPLTTSSDGWFQLPDSLGSDAVTYAVTYAGDADHTVANTEITLTPTRSDSSFTATGGGSVARSHRFAFHATLTSGGERIAGAVVTIRRSTASGVATTCARTSSSGRFAGRNAGSGDAMWTATWPGDLQHKPVTTTWTTRSTDLLTPPTPVVAATSSACIPPTDSRLAGIRR